ncbi:MAG: heparinase II/III family protein [Acidobacteriota bacterium]|nr:heparinase II/III family protein [Acidobacteriota bacterium]
MSIISKFKRALRGEVSPRIALLESARRTGVATRQRGERARLTQQAKHPARLTPEFANVPPAALLDHFTQRTQPHFFPGFDLPLQSLAASQRTLFPEDSAALIANADRISREHTWPLLGLAQHSFVDWHRDPLSGFEWPLDFYSDIPLQRGDGSDVRIVWELNRLGHLLTLARAYSLTGDERYSAEFFLQINDWESRNPLGYGVNWNCAMEVALRALNLLSAFAVFRRAAGFDSKKLAQFLKIFDQHGTFIRDHLEFSYIATSNHYLSNVAGLLWLGVLLPELAGAAEWRAFGLRGLTREMSKQVLPDGADCESSTGYHRLVLELFAYSFLLCRLNAIEIEGDNWRRLHQMFEYLRGYLRPDEGAPLIGDSDSGQVFPICRRRGNDHGYLLAIGAVLFDDSKFKNDELPVPAELLWLFGEHGVRKYEALTPNNSGVTSQQFPDAGVYVLRNDDLYLLFNASGAGLNGRGSHGHNDGLSVEISVCGRAFIVDPGTYVYTADLHERHLFRSTAYHSTVQVDDLEQNKTEEATPFIIGDEARPRLVDWHATAASAESDRVSAEHYGYKRLPQAVAHRRTVIFHKPERFWVIEDAFVGAGEHKLAARFHFDSGLEVIMTDEGVRALDPESGHSLFVCSLDLKEAAELESNFTSRDYGEKLDSVSACWTLQRSMPATLRWIIVPACAGEDAEGRLRMAMEFSGWLRTQVG